MEKLIRAKELFEQISDLNDQIEALNLVLEVACQKKCKVRVKADSGKVEGQEKHPLHKFGGLSAMILEQDEKGEMHVREIHEKVPAPPPDIKYDVEIEDTEFLIMYGALLDYKTEKRKKLIEEFKQLGYET